ncbi:NAD-dependent epimerase/dehydratase family protein [Fulvivirga sedimenti]|uniref:NAD-dependent epimerase/dehydratase family protein n=1 Tax=Fulvivirga sedimenti TaxID=2879465 RepID=A0A9X1KYM3_9BACT|nr:NAD-dependent epimerase/dehydratase family protein [Fulvivirga sedimenti]MCA6078063.1 NAD-dependent epimerase/dehydratase family protein [Fulvivirga sedimenti]
MEKILIIGAGGQLGTELTAALREKHGKDAVVATDIREIQSADGPFEILDAMDADRLAELQSSYQFTQIYHLAAILSAKGENNPQWAWKLNMESLMNILELGKNSGVKRIFWPSSIAVFGPGTPRQQTPQHTIMDPTTVYGISKLAGERWCEYYFNKYNVDVRSIRYPGLISYKADPGGGTTDYAIDIFKQGLLHGSYTSFLSENTYLPMMYIDDAVRGTIELMDSAPDKIKTRSSYNLGAMSFSPSELAAEIKKYLPGFSINYEPDFRQAIADSWPDSINDDAARNEWGWKPQYDLSKLTTAMIDGMKPLLKHQSV